MGKVLLTGILLLALVPAIYGGTFGGRSRFAMSPSRLESNYEVKLNGIYENYGTNCAWSLGGEDQSDFIMKVNKLNSLRSQDFRKRGYQVPSDYSMCGGEGYGYGA
jgi:hypothetical protein